MPKNKNLKEGFIKDYYRVLFDLSKKIEPLIEEGWSQDEVLGLFVFMEQKQDIVQGKDIQVIKKLYMEHKNGKKKY